MSTYANVEIEGREFSVRSDGWDKETIRDCVREYVAKIKGKVKPDYLLTAVIDAIVSESAGDYYAPFALGCWQRHCNGATTVLDWCGDKLMTSMNQNRLRKPTRWESEKKQQKRITNRDRVAILNAYEKGLQSGEDRGKLLEEIAQTHGKSIRQIERYVSSARRQRERKAGPYLEMEFIPAQVYTDERRIFKCACVNVWNRGSREAQKCWGTLRLLSIGDSLAHKYQEAMGSFRLHWAGLPFEEEAPTVDIAAEGPPCRLDIAFSLPPPLERARPVGAISSGQVAGLSSLHNVLSERGCWIAVPAALLQADVTNSFYLAPNRYQVEVTVGWADKRGRTQEFVLVSRASWEGLSLVPCGRPGHRGSPSWH